MKIRHHADGTYSLIGLTREEVRDLENGLGANSVSFLRAAEAAYVPSGYQGWTLENYHSINRQIADRIEAMAKLLQPIAYPA